MSYQKLIHIAFLTFTIFFAIVIHNACQENIQYSKQLKENGVNTVATITSGFFDNHHEMWTFNFRFQDKDKKSHTGRTKYSNGNKDQYKKGEKIKIVYLDGDQKNARVDHPVEFYGAYVGYLFVALIFVVNALGIYKHKEVKRFLTLK